MALRYRREHAECAQGAGGADHFQSDERSLRFVGRLWQAAAQRAGACLDS
jgi:hypothetical protein